MKQLALMGTSFTEAQLAEITETARNAGYQVLALETTTSYPEDILEGCEILVGYFPKKLLRQARSLRWLQLPSAGADRYVGDYYPHGDFVLTNASGVFGSAIAEQLLMGTLMLLRRMPEYSRQQQAHLWNRVGNLRFLKGSTVTILGTGNLGGTFARYCRSLGATVRGVSRSGREKDGFDQVYPISERLSAVEGAQVVAACLPLTGETQGLLDGDFFAHMPEGSVFLNVGRGKTVCEAALIQALESGHLAGAMLDVAETEPLPPESPLWDMAEVILTPHVSGSDLDPQNADLIYQIFLDNLHCYLEGKPLQNVVDRNLGY
jgi:phosphoglycerate dehydrogenase-like enzyme